MGDCLREAVEESLRNMAGRREKIRGMDMDARLHEIGRLFIPCVGPEPEPDPDFTKEQAEKIGEALGVIYPSLKGVKVTVESLSLLSQAIRGWCHVTFGYDPEQKVEKREEMTVEVK